MYYYHNFLIYLSLSFPVLCVLLGAPLLGSTEAVRAALSGTTFGLPVSEVSRPLVLNEIYVILS